MSENTPSRQNLVIFFFSKFLILVGMVLVFLFVSTAIAMLLSNVLFGVNVFSDPYILNQYENNPAVLNSLKLIQIFNSVGAFLIPAWYFPRSFQQWPAEFLQVKNRVGIREFLPAFLLMIVSMPFVSWLIYINEHIQFPAAWQALETQLKTSDEAAQKLAEAFTRGSGILHFLGSLLIVGVLPAICEEFLFRGALQRFLMLCLRNKHIAVIITAMLFSAIHGQFYGFLPRFALGMILGYIAWFSGSIWPAVLGHFINNTIALLALQFDWNKSPISVLHEDYEFPIYTTISSGVLCIGIIWWMYQNMEKKTIYNGE